MERKLIEIAEYCCYDVKITRMLHEYGAAHKQLFYRDRFWEPVVGFGFLVIYPAARLESALPQSTPLA